MPTIFHDAPRRSNRAVPGAETLDRIVRRLSGARIRLTYYDLRFRGVSEDEIALLLEDVAGSTRFQFFVGLGRVVVLDVGPRQVSGLPFGDRSTTTAFSRDLARGIDGMTFEDDGGAEIWLAIQHGWSHEWAEAAAILRQLEASPRTRVFPA